MSIKKKLLIFSSLFILFFSIALVFVIQYSANKNLKEEYANRGRILAQNMAYNSKVALLFMDVESLQEQIEAIMQQSDVEFAIIYDDSGRVLASSGAEIAWDVFRVSQARAASPWSYHFTRGRIDTITPIETDEGVKGFAVVGLSLGSLNEKIAAANSKAMVFIAVFVLTGVLSLFYATRRPLRTVEELKSFAEEIAAGKHGRCLDVVSSDELGDLSRALNKMAKNIQSAFQEAQDHSRKAGEFAANLEKEHQRTIEEAKKLERTITTIIEALERIKQGDLRTGITLDGNDEINRVSTGVNMMIAELTTIICKLRDASNAISQTARNIDAVGKNISRGANMQQEQTEAIASSFDQVADSLDKATHVMEHAGTIATNAHEAAREGGNVVNKAIEGITRTASVIDESTRVVRSLGSQSQEISDIVQVINEIADQTNLLALNAAIEAARAGEQGRGFAVVADEVRKLAERTSDATSEIASMIQKILTLTDQAVRSMDNGNKEMQNGKVMVQKVGTALDDILASVQSMQSEFSKIIATGKEQSAAAASVKDKIHNIRSIVQENKQHSDSVLSAAQELNRQTEQLVDLVSHFQLGDSSAIIALNDAVSFADVQTEEKVQNERRGQGAAPGQIVPEGRRKEDKGTLSVTPDGTIDTA